jgi:multiple antibiotic resistance protein
MVRDCDGTVPIAAPGYEGLPGADPSATEANVELAFQSHFFYEFVTLLAVLDPTAAIPVFLGVTAGLSTRQSLKVAAYAVATAFIVLLFFICVGQLLLEALGIPMPSFQLAGSIVLVLFGLKLVLGQITAEAEAMPATATMAQRAVYPLAIPTIAGAGSMLTVVLLTDNSTRSIAEQAVTTLRMMICLVIVFGVLALSKPIYRLVGKPGIEVLSRVSGLILAAIGVNGIILAVKMSFR